MPKINSIALKQSSSCPILTGMVNKTKEVLEKYKPYLTALPGTTLIGMGAVSNAIYSRPGILITVKTEKDAKLLSNLLAKKIEGVPIKIEAGPTGKFEALKAE